MVLVGLKHMHAKQKAGQLGKYLRQKAGILEALRLHLSKYITKASLTKEDQKPKSIFFFFNPPSKLKFYMIGFR